MEAQSFRGFNIDRGVLHACLRDEAEAVRFYAACTLAEVDPEGAKELVPTVMSGMNNTKDRWRPISAAEAIMRVAPTQFRRVGPRVERLLKDESEYVVWRAALAIRDFGPAAKPAIPALMAVLRKGLRRYLQFEVVSALVATQDPRVEKAFVEIAKDESEPEWLRETIMLQGLPEFAKSSTLSLDLLISASEDENERIPKENQSAGDSQIGRAGSSRLLPLVSARQSRIIPTELADDLWSAATSRRFSVWGQRSFAMRRIAEGE